MSLKGLFPAILGTLHLLLLGTITKRVILHDLTDLFECRLASIALSFGFSGLIVMFLSYLRSLNIFTVFIVFWVVIAFFLYLEFRREKLQYIGPYLMDCLSLWKPSKPKFSSVWTRITWTTIFCIFLTVFYHAIMFPPLETDSIIYHAPMASILFNERGLPLMKGGGVGTGSSANYPFLFPALGTYYYLWVGFVQDLFLRIITPVMGLLSIIATYSLGDEVGGKKLGLIAAFLFSMVPSYLSYSSLSTQETTVTFFLVMGVLFLVKAFNNDQRGYWIFSGVFFGFSMLTTYQALYFVPPLLLALFYHWYKNRHENIGLNSLTMIFTLIFSMMVVGCIPYLRNWLILGNPVYPFFNGVFKSKALSPFIHTYTVNDWNYVASYLVTGKSVSSKLEFILSLFTYSSFYPLNYLLLFPATFLFLFSKVKMRYLVLSFIFIPSFLILFNQPSFIRYFWLTMPYASLIVGQLFVRGFEISDELGCFYRINLPKVFKIAFLATLAVMVIFPAFVAVEGQAFTFAEPFWDVPGSSEDYLRYTVNPNMNIEALLQLIYGSDASAWKWLSENTEPDSKIAAFETRIYYIKDSKHDAIFSLDNLEAEDLYDTYNQEDAVSFLKQNGVGYVFVRVMDWEAILFKRLPLTKFLSSPQFPLVFDGGLSKIYKVGPLPADPVINDPSYVYAGPIHWSDVEEMGGVPTRSIIRESSSPRLFVSASDLMELNIRYLDRGIGVLSVNVYDTYSKTWIHAYEIIKKEDTGDWKWAEFLVPIDLNRGFIQLGLYASMENFVVSKIEVEPLRAEGKTTLGSLERASVSNSTKPPSTMVYLPILGEGEKLYFSSNSYGKEISVEVFEGYVPINTDTEWWLKHVMIARSPQLPVLGSVDPDLTWQAKESGLYTLVIVLWDEYDPETKLDFQISVGGSH